MDAREEFEREIRDASPGLDRLSLLVAAHAVDDLDLDEEIDRLDGLAEQFAGADVEDLCAHLCGPAGFTPNLVDYYDPENSYLPIVLRRRMGIPLTLAIVAIEVGRRHGIEVVGVGMPGEFLIRAADDDRRWWSLFRGPRAMGREELATLFASIHGSSVPLEDEYLSPCPVQGMIERMLTNLIAIHRRRGDLDSLAWATELVASMPGVGVDRLRLAAAVAEQRGRYWDAAAHWDRVAGLDAERADEAGRRAARLRARSN